MLSGKSIAGLCVTGVVAILLIYKFTPLFGGSTSPASTSNIDNFTTFKKQMEDGGFTALVDTSGAGLKDNRKNIYTNNQVDIRGIIMADLYTYYSRFDGIKKFYNDLIKNVQEAEKKKNLQKFILECLKIDLNATSLAWSNEVIFDQKTIFIEDVPLKTIPIEALLIFTKLEELNFTKTGLKENFEVLSRIHTLKKLLLIENGIEKLPNFSEFEALEEVDMDKNNLTGVINLDHYKVPGRSEYKPTKIKVLDLQRNKITELPADFIKVFPQLETVYLFENTIKAAPAHIPGPKPKFIFKKRDSTNK